MQSKCGTTRKNLSHLHTVRWSFFLLLFCSTNSHAQWKNLDNNFTYSSKSNNITKHIHQMSSYDSEHSLSQSQTMAYDFTYSVLDSSDSTKRYPSKWLLAVPVFGGMIYGGSYPEIGAKTHVIAMTGIGDFFGIISLVSGIVASSRQSELRDDYNLKLNRYHSATSIESVQSARDELESAYGDLKDNRETLRITRVATPILLGMSMVARCIEIIWGGPDTQEETTQESQSGGTPHVSLITKRSPDSSPPMLGISIHF
jgi:hypothetical protein